MKKFDLGQIKEDMKMLFVKINYSNDAYMQARKDIVEIKNEIKLADNNNTNSRERLREQYETFVT